MSRGRKPGFKMPEEHRLKIANSNILNALIEHVQGEREMSATQVSAGLGLLRKCLPDLSQTDIKADVTTRSVMRMPAPAKDAETWITTLSGSPSQAPKQH